MIGSIFGGVFLSAIIAILGGVVAVDNFGSLGAILEFSIGGFTIICIIYFLCTYLYWKAYIKSYFYDANDNFLTIRKGVFSSAEIHVQYSKIQDVYVDRDIMDRILGLYDVHIASATMSSSIEAHIDGVDYKTAELLKEYLFSKIKNPKTSVEHNHAVALDNNHPEQKSSWKITDGISSKEYPIESKWLIVASIMSAGRTLVSLIIITLIVAANIKNTGFYGIGIFAFIIGAYLLWVVSKIVILMIWKKNYYFEFTEDYILMKTGVFTRSETHVPYRTIQNTTINQNFFDRLVGLAGVVIENASSGGATFIIGQSVANAEIINNIVSKIIINNKNAQTGL
jgi:putative membrane protein